MGLPSIHINATIVQPGDECRYKRCTVKCRDFSAQYSHYVRLFHTRRDSGAYNNKNPHLGLRHDLRTRSLTLPAYRSATRQLTLYYIGVVQGVKIRKHSSPTLLGNGTSLCRKIPICQCCVKLMAGIFLVQTKEYCRHLRFGMAYWSQLFWKNWRRSKGTRGNLPLTVTTIARVTQQSLFHHTTLGSLTKKSQIGNL